MNSAARQAPCQNPPNTILSAAVAHYRKRIAQPVQRVGGNYRLIVQLLSQLLGKDNELDPALRDPVHRSYCMAELAIAYSYLGMRSSSISLQEKKIELDLDESLLVELGTGLFNYANFLELDNQLAKAHRVNELFSEYATSADNFKKKVLEIQKKHRERVEERVREEHERDEDSKKREEDPIFAGEMAKVEAHSRYLLTKGLLAGGRVLLRSNFGFTGYGPPKLELFDDKVIKIPTSSAVALSHLAFLRFFTEIGDWERAEQEYQAFITSPPESDTHYWRAFAEFYYATALIEQGYDADEHLVIAGKMAEDGKNKHVIRHLNLLRGEMYLKNDDLQIAESCFHQARSDGTEADDAVTMWHATLNLALVKALQENHNEAKALISSVSGDIWPARRAQILAILGETKDATELALRAFRDASADGFPYVWYADWKLSRTVLENLGADIPDCEYFHKMDTKLPFEPKMLALIKTLNIRA